MTSFHAHALRISRLNDDGSVPDKRDQRYVTLGFTPAVGVTAIFTTEPSRHVRLSPPECDMVMEFTCGPPTKEFLEVVLDVHGARDAQDAWLASSTSLRGIRGTAAAGRFIGRFYWPGDVYVAKSDRERRFVEAELAERGLRLGPTSLLHDPYAPDARRVVEA